MLLAVGRIVSKIRRGQRSERSDHEVDYNSLRMQLKTNVRQC